MVAPLIEIDDNYCSELALKNELLTHEYERYCQALIGTASLQWETLALVLLDMAQHYPRYFTLITHADNWTWQNRLLNSTTQFVFGVDSSLPLAPLDWLGRQVQEDLLILSGTKEDGIPLVAGHLCFPNAWCLDDKMRQSFLEIHQSVPGFAQSIGRSASLLMERLKVGRPVWRVNWSIMATPRLSLPPHVFQKEQLLSQGITRDNVGERCFVRIERQTLSRLPSTNGILFTVRTYQEPIAAVASAPDDARRILRVLQSAPRDFLRYKGVTSFADILFEYLAAKQQAA